MSAQRRLRTPVALRARLSFAAPLAGTFAGFMVLRHFPPASSRWYPPCPFYTVTGLLCPGCGSTRALAALVHGDFAEAWADNSLFLLLCPVLLAFGLTTYHRLLKGDDDPFPKVPRPALVALISSALIFAIARNMARI